MNDSSTYSLIKTQFLAEAVCASMMEQGMYIDHIKTSFKGAFRKNYSADVETLEVDDELPHKINAAIAINRNGMYDLLPEGLFHQTRGAQVVRSVQDAVDEHKKYKEEEKQARKFFAPLEEMIFRYRVMAEESERKALYTGENEQLIENLFSFWNIEKGLPPIESARMLRLMPHVQHIKGNLQFTTEALSYILNKEVLIEDLTTYSKETVLKGQYLEDVMLGVNAVVAGCNNECFYTWRITVPVNNDAELAGLVPGTPFDQLLKRFVEIFIPIERDVYFEYTVAITENKNIDEHAYVLGYGCTI